MKEKGFEQIKLVRGVVHLIGDFKLTTEEFALILSLHGLTPFSMSKLINEFKGFLLNNITNTFKNSLIELKRIDTAKSYDNTLSILIKIMEYEEEYELCAELLKLKQEIITSFEECEERHKDLQEIKQMVNFY